jgi:photosystem II stability/assembly factor-like uncharacterized protein
MRSARLLTAFASLALAVLLAAPPRVHAKPLAQDWEQTTIAEPTAKLFVTASGGLFAQTSSGFMASSDSGESWRMLPPPSAPAASIVAVDPSNDAILYGRADDGLYKTLDSGLTWTRVLDATAQLQLAVSPADGQLLFLAQIRSATDMAFLRSTDGGATWSILEQRRSSLCGFRVLLLEPHPTDVSHVFRTADCYSGRSSSGALELSIDGGGHWSEVLRPFLHFVSRLVGGGGTDPGRFYVAASGGLSIGTSRGGSVFRSDDGGTSWVEVLSVPEDPSAVNEVVRISGLAYDPIAPNLVYAGLAGGETGVWASFDAGITWTARVEQDIGGITDLVVDAGGAYLFAATDQGVWRLPLVTEVDDGLMGCASARRSPKPLHSNVL